MTDLPRIDFHSHVLPGIDDGAKNVEESIKILDMMAGSGTEILYCTPHFYPHKQSLDRFLEKRDAAFEKLKPYLKPAHPKLRLGAEVLLSSSLLNEEKLCRLKLEGTDYVLLEMPYMHFSSSIYDGVYEAADYENVKILIAHIERYLGFNSMKEVMNLFSEENVLGQINCNSLVHFKSRHACLKLIKEGYVHALGTDYHRIQRGDPLLDRGIEILRKKLSEKEFGKLGDSIRSIMENAEVEDII